MQTAAVGLQAAVQVVPAGDFMHGSYRMSFSRMMAGVCQSMRSRLRKPRLNPRAEKMHQIASMPIHSDGP